MGVARPLGAARLAVAAPKFCNGRINAVASVHSGSSLPHVCSVGLHLGVPENGAEVSKLSATPMCHLMHNF